MEREAARQAGGLPHLPGAPAPARRHPGPGCPAGHPRPPCPPHPFAPVRAYPCRRGSVLPALPGGRDPPPPFAQVRDPDAGQGESPDRDTNRAGRSRRQGRGGPLAGTVLSFPPWGARGPARGKPSAPGPLPRLGGCRIGKGAGRVMAALPVRERRRPRGARTGRGGIRHHAPRPLDRASRLDLMGGAAYSAASGGIPSRMPRTGKR